MWIKGCVVLETQRLGGIRWKGVVVSVGEVRVISTPWIVCA